MNSWKSRSIHGYEKYIFLNLVNQTKQIKRFARVDPARFIYPRDAMGDLRHRKTTDSNSFYLPKYDFVKPNSPKWSIKNKYDAFTRCHYRQQTYLFSNKHRK